MNPVEITSIDRRFEDLRLKNRSYEGFLLNSIQKEGIRQPLGCFIEASGVHVLLDGFKRLRSALKLGIQTVNVSALGTHETQAICELLFQSSENHLSILEQAAFCDHLHKRHKIGVLKIAAYLKKSPAWVSVRLGILNQMSEEVKKAVFQGRFPVRSYMYTLKQFTRVNKIPQKEIDEFVTAVSGKNLSTRDIERLAWGFFKGEERLRREITRGRISPVLKELKSSRVLLEGASLNSPERKILWDLEVLSNCISRLIFRLRDPGLKDPSFLKKTRFLIDGILGKIKPLIQSLREFK